MNTRSFLKSLLVAAVAPQVLAAVAKDRCRWTKTISGLYVINPAWVTAKYELTYIGCESLGYRELLRPWEEESLKLPYSARFNEVPHDMGSQLKLIHPWIEP